MSKRMSDFEELERQRVERVTQEHFADPAEGYRREDGTFVMMPGSLQRLTEKLRPEPSESGGILCTLERWMEQLDEDS